MSISGSMYSGLSGLHAQGEAMNTISNNLANTNTIGYKSATMQFEDVFYSTLYTSNGYGQVGNGVSISTISYDLTQGSTESTSESMNMALGGNGYFMVGDPNSTGDTYYTRAGNFSFDSSGYLVNPQGYRVQGWDVDAATASSSVPQTTGALGDIYMESTESPPQATSTVSMQLNLNSASTDKSTSTTNPCFSLLSAWDGTATTALSDTAYSYQTTIKVYDEAGTSHDLTVYFDPASDNLTNTTGGQTTWEYIVTMNPDEDGRTIGGTSLNGTTSAGLLMAGTLTFNSSGQLTASSAFTPKTTSTGDLTDLTNWTPAAFGTDGYPVFAANFSGSPNASTTDDTGAIDISLNFGMSTKTPSSGWSTTVANASAIGTDASALITMASPKYASSLTTSREASSTTTNQSQNGYAVGTLQGVEVDKNGTVYGNYSNGQKTALFVVGLATFKNPQGLELEGSNLYEATTTSGEALVGRANTAGFGTIAGKSLEQSNVDMSNELVRMITTQRGYQASSKSISTVDEMLQTALGLKR